MVQRDTLLTARQAAARLSISVSSLYGWTERGRLSVVKLSGSASYRWSEQAIEDFIATHQQSAVREPLPLPTRRRRAEPRSGGLLLNDDAWREYLRTGTATASRTKKTATRG